MQIKSPLDSIDNALLALTVSVNGTPINSAYAIKSIQVVHAVNKISFAELVLQGEVNNASQSLLITDSDVFNPGNSISIAAGYGNAAGQSIFSGFIVNHAVEINPTTNFTVRILCKHAAVAMTYMEREAAFFNQSDTEIISAIADKYGLSVSVDNTIDQPEVVIQKRTTDWDFILSRCHYNGCIVCMDGNSLHIGKPVLDGVAVLKIEGGASLISFEGNLNAEFQPQVIKASAWDSTTQALVSATAGEPVVNAQGNISPQALSGKFSQTELDLVIVAPLDSTELQTRADAALLWKRLSAITGKSTFIGNASVKTGNLVELAGVGKKFEGKVFVSGVMHTIQDGYWHTTVTFGLEQSPIPAKSGIFVSASVGILPAIQGLQIATVIKTNEDPESSYRVQIRMASSDSLSGIWARMASFYATSSAGAVFWPEVGDEVIVGFLDSDPGFPVILGSLFSEQNNPPGEVMDGSNTIKSLTTRSKMRLSFNEQQKSITLNTPANNLITISDEDQEINIADQNGNSIQLSANGIVLNSATDISLKANGNITLDATGKISVNAGQDVVVSGLNILNEAKVGFTGKGSATAELSASGQTVVKGALVIIN